MTALKCPGRNITLVYDVILNEPFVFPCLLLGVHVIVFVLVQTEMYTVC